MRRMIFERLTEKGWLECSLNGVEVEFHLNRKLIQKQNGGDIHRVKILLLSPRYRHIYEQLKQAGANAVWDLQVALFDIEAEQIKTSVAEAEEQAYHDELQQVANSDIKVMLTLYSGAPAMAESPLFRWHFMNADTLICKVSGRAICQMSYLRSDGGSDDITDADTVAAVRRFFNELHLIQKYVAAANEEKITAKLQQEEDAFYERNPRLKGLSKAEVDCKAEEWDRLYNEGGEGYNPYRSV